MQLPSDLAEWTYDTVVELVQAFELEPGLFDYKEALNASDPRNRDDLLRSIRRTACGMANTEGGFIIFGVRDRRQNVAAPVDRIVGIPLVGDLGKEFANKVAVLQPSLKFETAPAPIPLPGDPTRGLYVVRVAPTTQGPHMVQPEGVFFRRDAGGNSVPMDFYQVRDLMLMERQVVLANLKWELEENVIALCTRLEGLPSPAYNWLAETRQGVKLTAGDTRGPIRLTQQQAMRTTAFWTVSPEGERLRMNALREAAHSGQFLAFREEVGRLIGDEAYNAMQGLLNAIDSYQRIYRIVRDHIEWLATLLQAVREKWPYVDIGGEALSFLFALHDRQQDILKLSVALLRHILDPATEVRMPSLNPLSPLEGETEKILAHQSTHEEVEQWVSDNYLSGMITGEHTATQQEVIDALARYPKLDELIARPLRDQMSPHIPEFMQRLEADGMDAAMQWLQAILLGGKGA